MSMETYEEQLRRLEFYQELAISEKQFDEGKEFCILPKKKQAGGLFFNSIATGKNKMLRSVSGA